MFNGYKTYIIGTMAMAVGIYLETVTSGTGLELIFMGLGLMGVRHGVSKTQSAAEKPVVMIQEVEVPAKKTTKKKTK